MAKELKKAPVSENPVENRLKSLYKYQTVLSKIDEIRRLRGELPQDVQDLEDEIEGLGVRVANIQEELQKNMSDINRWKEDKIKAQADIERCHSHLDNVRNNREYDSWNKEIEYQQEQIKVCDKRVAEAKEKIEKREKDLEENMAIREERMRDLEAKKVELEEIVTETKAEEENLRDEAKILEATLDYRLLSSFKRIRKNSHNGLGIVYVQRDACGGCFNKIPPQRQLDVRMHKKVIVCEYCGRILIDPELAGVQVVPQESAEEKKPRRRRTTKKIEG